MADYRCVAVGIIDFDAYCQMPSISHHSNLRVQLLFTKFCSVEAQEKFNADALPVTTSDLVL